MQVPQAQRNGGVALWGGVECTVNRIGDRYSSQIELSGHVERESDIERFAGLGISAIRYPILWERTAPAGLESADWTWPDRRLALLREAEITPIAGLLHHGSGPVGTNLLDPQFPQKLAAYAGAVAERYPHLEYYTPVNEPLTTARFSALYGFWYPHARDERAFANALLNQCKATVLAMAAVWEVNSDAKLVQTEDLGRTYSTVPLVYQAQFNNELRWLGWDLLLGRVDNGHTLWPWLTGPCGIRAADLFWFCDHPCIPSIIGVNYYVTSERYLDADLLKYPPALHGGNGRDRYVDVEAARSIVGPTAGIGPLLDEVWHRYDIPIAVTEAHIDSTRDDQLRWLAEIWDESQAARRRGVDLRAFTVWALLGSFDWNSLVTVSNGYYEPGAFDLRSPAPRETAVAHWMRRIAAGNLHTDAVLGSPGWWKRERAAGIFRIQDENCEESSHGGPAPILIVGAGALGRSLARCCQFRGLAFLLRTAAELDTTDVAAVEGFMVRHRPWAVINAGDPDTGSTLEDDVSACFRANVLGPGVLAASCFKHGVPLLSFSSEIVFDGKAEAPYLESAPTSPVGVYASSQVEGERAIMERCPAALIVRTGSLFGACGEDDPIRQALSGASPSGIAGLGSSRMVTPTYVPDLANACLDLMIDSESGLIHLTHETVTTWPRMLSQMAELVREGEGVLAMDSPGQSRLLSTCGALLSERCHVLPSLANALRRYASHLPSRS